MNAESNTAYQILPSEGYIIIKFNGHLGSDVAQLFNDEIKMLTGGPPFNHIIINCSNLSELTKPWIRVLIHLVHDIQKMNKDVRFIMVSPDVNKFFVTEGVNDIFKTCSNLREALVQLKLVTKKALDTNFINPFLDATLQVLKVQAQTDAVPGKLFIKSEKDKLSGDISGVIGIVSSTFNGSVVISFPEQTFLKLMSRMLGDEFTILTKEIADGAGELTNIIFGMAKVVLNEKGYGINTALPSVITGKGHSVTSLTNGPIVVVPFETDIGPFFVEICISA
ncbi:MAG: chemotaxis protein CheX [Bacteriovorax sp.]|jgi:chemotaxis protein CheX